MAKWNTSGSQVYNGLSGTTYQDLDLTTDTGLSPTGLSGSVLAFLSVEVWVGGAYVAFRQKGDGDDWYEVGTYSYGTSLGVSTSAGGQQFLLVAVKTDSSGICQWKSGGFQNTRIDLVGWIACDVSTEGLFSGSAPTSWTDEDIGVGSVESLSFLKFLRTGGTANWAAVRQNGELEDMFDGNVGAKGGASQSKIWTTNKAYGMLVPSDSGGLIEHISQAVVPQYSIERICNETDGWYPDGSVVFASATPPTSYTDLDLGSYVGSMQAFVFLKIKRKSGAPGAYEKVAVRPNGSSDDFLIQNATYPAGCACCSLEQNEATIVCCETDGSGVIEWIAGSNSYQFEVTLLGYFSVNSPPSFSGTAPTGPGNAPDANVTVDIADDVSVTLGSVKLDLTAPDTTVYNVIVAGAFVPGSGWSGTISANGSNGYDIVVSPHPPFCIGKWSAYCEASDGMVTASTLWSWTVTANAPSVRLTDPVAGSPVMDSPPSLLISVEDDWGVDSTTVDLVAVSSKGGEIEIISAGSFLAGFSGSIQSNGFGGSDIIVFWDGIDNACEKMVNWIFTLDLDSIVGVAL